MNSQTNPETTPTPSAPAMDVSQSLPDVAERPKSRLEKLLAPFRRVTSNGQYIPVIDGLRFVAIMMVVMYHLNDYIVHKKGWVDDPEVRSSIAFQIFNAGNVGVQLFFAISGFILALPFIEKVQQGKPLGLKKYFLRRLTRLEPPYIINLTIVLLLLIFWKGQSFSDLIGPYFASLFYVHNIVYGEMSRINGVAWSLEIEVQFYVLAPILFSYTFRLSPPIRQFFLITLILLGSLDSLVSPVDLPRNWSLSLFGQFEYFFTGILVADRYFHCDPRKTGSAIFDALAILAISFLVLTWNSTLGCTLAAPLIALFLNSTLRSSFISTIICNPIMTTIGGMCYTIYLYHFFVISVLAPVLPSESYPRALASSMLLFPIVALFCMPMFMAFERTFMHSPPTPQNTQR